MGNIDSRAKFDCGYLMIQTDKPHYEPGDLITGTIFIRCSQQVQAKHIMLEVKGKEKASWIDMVERRTQGPYSEHTIREPVKRKADKKIMESKSACFVF